MECKLTAVEDFINKKLDKAEKTYEKENLSRSKASIAYSAGMKLVAMGYDDLANKDIDAILSPLGYTFEQVKDMIRRDSF